MVNKFCFMGVVSVFARKFMDLGEMIRRVMREEIVFVVREISVCGIGSQGE